MRPRQRAVSCALAATLALPLEALAGAARSISGSRGGKVSFITVPVLPALAVPIGASVPQIPQASLIQRLAGQAERAERLVSPEAGQAGPEAAAEESRQLMDLAPARSSVSAAPPGPQANGGSSGLTPPGPRRPRRGIGALGRIFRYDMVQRRVEELLDLRKEAGVRANAARELATLNKPETIEALAEAGISDPDAEVRAAARQTLALLGGEWGASLTRVAALHPLRGRRIAAIRSLGALARFDASLALIETLGDKASLDIDSEVRLSAVEALKGALSPKALMTLRQLRAAATRPDQISALELAIVHAQRRQVAAGVPFAAYRAPEEGLGTVKVPLHYAALKRVIGIAAIFTAIELAGSMYTGSLSLKADAMHLATDLAINVGALFAIWMSRRPPNSRKSYGYLKIESVVGLASAAVIGLIGVHTGVEALQRLGQPTEVPGLLTMALASAGLAANLISTLLLYRYRDESLSLKGAFLHSAIDALGSVGIIVAGLLIWGFGWFIADPIISMLIVGLILHTTFGLAKRSWNVLMDSVPPGINLEEIERELLALPGVVSVYDLHVWSLNSAELVATVSLYVAPGVALEPTLNAAKAALKKRRIGHSTVEIKTIP